jgi:hypothetical protein
MAQSSRKPKGAHSYSSVSLTPAPQIIDMCTQADVRLPFYIGLFAKEVKRVQYRSIIPPHLVVPRTAPATYHRARAVLAHS